MKAKSALKNVTFFCKNYVCEVPMTRLVEYFPELLQDHPDILKTHTYHVTADVSVESARQLFEAVNEDRYPEINDSNITDMEKLAQEIQWDNLLDEIEDQKAYPDVALHSDVQVMIAETREMVDNLEIKIAQLAEMTASTSTKVDKCEKSMNNNVSVQSAIIKRLLGDIRKLQSDVEVLKGGDSRTSSDLKSEIDALKAQMRETLETNQRLAKKIEEQEKIINELRAPPADRPAPAQAPKRNERIIAYTGNKFEGILHTLSKEHGSNLHDKKIVLVTDRDDFMYKDHPPQCIIESGNTTVRYISKDEENPWIMIDFGHRRILPTHYSLRTYWGEPGFRHLKSWTLDVSVDGETWHCVDTVVGSPVLNGPLCEYTDSIKEAPTLCRFVKLTMNGKNFNQDHCLVLTGIELFGTLIE